MSSKACGVRTCWNRLYSDILEVKAYGQKRIFFLSCCGVPVCISCYRDEDEACKICKFCRGKPRFVYYSRKTSCSWNGPYGLYEERKEYMALYSTFAKNSPDFYDRFFGSLPIRGCNWRNLRDLTQYFGEKHRSIWRMFMFFATRVGKTGKIMRFLVQPSTFDEVVTMQNYVEMSPPLKYPPTDRSAMFYRKMVVKYCHFGIFETLVSRMTLPTVAMPMMSIQNQLQLQRKLATIVWRKIFEVFASKVSWNLCL